MKPIIIIDRHTKKEIEEKIYGASALKLMYGNSWLSKILKKPLHLLISKFPPFSFLFGKWQRLPFTKKKIAPFVKNFQIDPTEFIEPLESFRSFNDFFIRKLKPAARPIAQEQESAIMPADGRYTFFQNVVQTKNFLIKGETFNLQELLQSDALAQKYSQGSMVIARLSPADYHRYHFPVDCIPGESQLINGYFHSVNPIAIKQNIHVLTKNKRSLCILQSIFFGQVLFIEIGAACVGSIHQTYTPYTYYAKGAEKGYFSFGASTLILLFEPDRLILDQDLIEASAKSMEIKCNMGQQMGVSGRELWYSSSNKGLLGCL